MKNGMIPVLQIWNERVIGCMDEYCGNGGSGYR